MNELIKFLKFIILNKICPNFIIMLEEDWTDESQFIHNPSNSLSLPPYLPWQVVDFFKDFRKEHFIASFSNIIEENTFSSNKKIIPQVRGKKTLKQLSFEHILTLEHFPNFSKTQERLIFCTQFHYSHVACDIQRAWGIVRLINYFDSDLALYLNSVFRGNNFNHFHSLIHFIFTKIRYLSLNEIIYSLRAFITLLINHFTVKEFQQNFFTLQQYSCNYENSLSVCFHSIFDHHCNHNSDIISFHTPTSVFVAAYYNTQEPSFPIDNIARVFYRLIRNTYCNLTSKTSIVVVNKELGLPACIDGLIAFSPLGTHEEFSYSRTSCKICKSNQELHHYLPYPQEYYFCFTFDINKHYNYKVTQYNTQFETKWQHSNNLLSPKF